MATESLYPFFHHLFFFQHLFFIAVAIMGLGFLVGFHELGHFLFCKIFGIATPSFSIGFGPKLISKKIGETEFSLSLLPLGGYVEIAGAAEVGQGAQKEAHSCQPDSFSTKPYYQKLLVMLGGIAFNIMFAYAAAIGIFWIAPDSQQLFPFNVVHPIIENIEPESAAARSGLQPGDLLRSVNGTLLAHNPTALITALQKSSGSPLNLVIERNQQAINFSIAPDTVPTQGETGKTRKTLGIVKFKTMTAGSIVQSITQGVKFTNYYIYLIGKALVDIITRKGEGVLGGPLMIISMSSKEAAKGISEFLLLLSNISINLALLNLIPLPIFDGGQILFYSLEALAGKPLSPKTREYIHIATWLLILALIIFISVRDVIYIISPYVKASA